MAFGSRETCSDHGAREGLMRAFLAAIWICVGAPAALAQSYSASGQVGYLGEWEVKASLTKTLSRTAEDFEGPMTLRHVGLCSVNGVEEKSGTMRLMVSRSGVEGTLVMADDSCSIKAAASPPYAGLMSCRNGGGVPIRLSIGQADAADRTALAGGK
jgi:hypothetical protein